MNIDDYFEGRQAKHVLSDMDVRAIRRDYKPPMRLSDGTWQVGNGRKLARIYGVEPKTIYNAVHGYTYSWVTDDKDTRPMHIRKRVGYLTIQQVRDIRANYKPYDLGAGYVKAVCEKYNVHRNTVYKILRGETYKDVKQTKGDG